MTGWTTNLDFSAFEGKSNLLKSEKPIFDSGYSSTSLFIMGCSGFLCAGLLFVLLLHIGQYPVTVSLLSLFLLRTIIDAKAERIIVSEDRFVIVTRRLLPFLTKKRVVLFSTVESIHIPPGQRETFLVRYKDGDRRRLSPLIHMVQFQKAMGVIEACAINVVRWKSINCS